MHKHAHLMAEYAKDALENDIPWKLWQFFERGDDKWIDCIDNPCWSIYRDYRRKPQLVEFGGFEFTKPLTKAPARNTRYYIPCLGCEQYYLSYEWCDDASDRRFLSRGLVHLTTESAINHARALLTVVVDVR